jgi:hypothetical protein
MSDQAFTVSLITPIQTFICGSVGNTSDFHYEGVHISSKHKKTEYGG